MSDPEVAQLEATVEALLFQLATCKIDADRIIANEQVARSAALKISNECRSTIWRHT